MSNRLSRRNLMHLAGATGASALLAPEVARAAATTWPLNVMGPGIPKICAYAGTTPAANRALQQVGVFHVIGGGGGGGRGGGPWTEEALRRNITALKDQGMTVVNAMIGGMNDIIRGGPNRDREIENIIQSTRAAGKAGLPCIEYNFYAHRLEEGYFHAPDPARGGAVVESFHYNQVKDLPPLPETGIQTADRLWANLEYFLKAVVPVAQSVNVRMSLHPNDPPPAISRGSAQIMTTFADWKKLVGLVDSPSNGMTYDCGVSREIGEDPAAVARWLGERDRISHVHFRNVIVRKEREDYTEVWPDNGMVDMLAVMKELVRQKYPRMVHPEHARGLNVNDNVVEKLRDPAGERGSKLAADEDPNLNSYAAWAYHAAYTRAMLQAALLTR